jgi:hypothetical protein
LSAAARSLLCLEGTSLNRLPGNLTECRFLGQLPRGVENRQPSSVSVGRKRSCSTTSCLLESDDAGRALHEIFQGAIDKMAGLPTFDHFVEQKGISQAQRRAGNCAGERIGESGAEG